MAKGWIIEVRYFQGGAEVLQRFDVAIGNPDEAIAAVRRLIGPAAELRIEEQLFDATLSGLGLGPGEVHPRLRRLR